MRRELYANKNNFSKKQKWEVNYMPTKIVSQKEEVRSDFYANKNSFSKKQKWEVPTKQFLRSELHAHTNNFSKKKKWGRSELYIPTKIISLESGSEKRIISTKNSFSKKQKWEVIYMPTKICNFSKISVCSLYLGNFRQRAPCFISLNLVYTAFFKFNIVFVSHVLC